MTARLLVGFPDGARERSTADLSDLRGTPSWLDVQDPSDAEAFIAEELGLHPLAVEDARSCHERPKAGAYDGYCFIAFSAITAQSPGALRTDLFSMFAIKDVMVTVRHSEWPARADVEKRWRD